MDPLSDCSTGQMESAYKKTSCFGINWRDTYFFDHRDTKSSNFLWKCVEGPPRARDTERNASWMDEFRPTAISCWKDVLALMHTVQGKIVNRITRNVMGTHGKFSCSFYVEKRTFWFYEVVLDACCGTHWRIFSEFLSLQDWIWVQFVDRLMLIRALHDRLFSDKREIVKQI